MRRTLALVALLCLPVLSGCIQSDPGGAPGSASEPSADDYAHLVCEPSCNVNATPVNGPLNEVDIAINPADPDVLLAGGKDYSHGTADPCGTYNVWSGVYTSHDAGRSWNNTFLPNHPHDDTNDTGALSAYNCVSDPVVAFSHDGQTAYYLGLSESYGPSGSTLDATNGFVLARSTDGGRTWPADEVNVVTANQAPPVFNDKEWMAVAPNGDIHVVWAAFTGFVSNQIVHSVSTDGGQTWTPPKTLFSTDAESANVASQGAWPAVAPDGTVYAIWHDFAEPHIKLVESTDGGRTFTQPRTIVEFTRRDQGSIDNADYRTPMNPQMAIDANGTMAVTYADWMDGHYDVKVIRSDDGGASWSDPVTVNDDGTATDQFFPALTAGPTGAKRDDFHMIWYDRRDTGNTNITVYYARSPDGANWSENLRISTDDFDGNLGIHQRGFPFIGDYIGIAVGPETAHAFWADTRTGTSRGWTATIDLSKTG